MRIGLAHRVLVGGWLALASAGCGVPSAEDARLRPPPDGARITFDRPFADVYAATKAIIAAERQTPEWKELEIRVDDPDAGIVIAERRLAGVIPGVAVRDLWSFYLARLDDSRTQVTFVIESSDRPKPAASARSWAQGNGTIFPAMRRVLAEADSNEPAMRRADEVAPRPASAQPAPAVPAPTPTPKPAARPRPTEAVGADVLERAHTALRTDADWRAATTSRTHEGQRLVLVGAWAQLSASNDRIQIAFPSYPAPPAYDVARLMRFLADAGFRVEVLPGSAFRSF